jgi:broad specificity phosphatase PhoE
LKERKPVTTTFFLVRHAVHGQLGRVLAGRTPGVRLDEKGIAQAKGLGRRLLRERITAVHSSPRERAVETAYEIARPVNVTPRIEPAIDEIDCGDWTGCSFDDLHADPRWISWNTARSVSRVPSGESMAEVQERIMAYLARESRREPDGRIVTVSHSDVIKAALLACLGLSLDHVERIEISPACVSTIVVGEWGSKVLSINEAMCS